MPFKKPEEPVEPVIEAVAPEVYAPVMQNAPVGTVDATLAGVSSAIKAHEDALRTYNSLQREAPAPKCILSETADGWSWAYGRQGKGPFDSKIAARDDARANLVPLVDASGVPIDVTYEVV